MWYSQLENEQQNGSGSGTSQQSGFSLWRNTTESREDKLLKLSAAIPELVKQVEVSSL